MLNFFLDCGAYSVHKGTVVHVDLDKYIAFIHKNKPWIQTYANLDVIGNPRATWKNQKEMECQGLSPLPVYHDSEDFKWLRRYADEYDHFGLGGTESSLLNKYELFPRYKKIITEVRGERPFPKVHGFGISNFDLIESFPFYSVDSTTWTKTREYFWVWVLKERDGKLAYDQQPYRLIWGMNTVPRLNVDQIDYIRKRLKSKPQGMKFPLWMEPQVPRYYFSGWPDRGLEFYQWGIKSRLLSFHQIPKAPDFLKNYVEREGLSEQEHWQRDNYTPSGMTRFNTFCLQIRWKWGKPPSD